MSIDWTQLPPELLQAVSEKLLIYGDYVRFLAVCRAWRNAVPSVSSQTHLPPQLPWLMLSHSDSHPVQTTRTFFDLSTNTVHYLDLPEASYGKHRCGSSNGWLIILDETPEITMLNPLSRSRRRLPPLSSFPEVVSFSYADVGREYALLSAYGVRYTRNLRQMRDRFIKKVVLSSSPGRDSNFVALAIFIDTDVLAFCINGDESWRPVEGGQTYCEDAIYHKDSFYAVDKHGGIAVFDVHACDSDSSSPRVSIMEISPHDKGGDMEYLVSSEDELLLVTRFVDMEFDMDPRHPHLIYRTSRFEVYKLDWVKSEWVAIRDLGDRVIFIGENSSLSLSASDFPGCTPDCIYFTDDYSETDNDGLFSEPDLGIFKLSDGSIDSLPCYPRNSYDRHRSPPPIWVTPNPC